MQKISFKDMFGLTDLVLSGQKTQTRRIEKSLLPLQTKEIKGQRYKFFDDEYKRVTDDLRYLDTAAPDMYAVIVRTTDEKLLEFKPQYRMGEVVAVAQNYEKAKVGVVPFKEGGGQWGNPRGLKGWSNKMFVRPELMPHTIKITNIRIERLQDISDEDCLAEGIEKMIVGCEYYCYSFLSPNPNKIWEDFKSPRQAYATLIDKVNGKGTWASNPYVFVYDFELVK